MKNDAGLIGDIPVGNWIDRWVPHSIRPYLRLMRLDRPIGTWLLLLPGWWSIALADPHGGNASLFLLFAIGSVVMRGAGCVINDIADHEFDAKVARTAGRPIPSGAVSVRQAWVFLGFLLLIGLGILLLLPPFAMLVGAASLVLVFPYPLMKRITWWPQAWLGLTFNWGALLGWAAVHQALDWPAILLYAAGIMWTLGYDTIYAHQDKDDDVLIGVKSTALRFGQHSHVWIGGFYTATVILLALAGYAADLAWWFYPLLLAASAQLLWQVRTGILDDSQDCLIKFKSNRYFGWAVLGAILLAKI